MEYKNLDIEIDFNACGHGRGYYEVEYDKLKEDLDEYLSTIEYKGGKELKGIVEEYIKEHEYSYRGDFVFVRNDMEEETIIEIGEVK